MTLRPVSFCTDVEFLTDVLTNSLALLPAQTAHDSFFAFNIVRNEKASSQK